MLRKLIFTFLLLTGFAFGQGSLATGNPVVVNSAGNPLPTTLTAICSADPGSTTPPCGTLATLYTDITMGTACSGVPASEPLNNVSAPSVGSGCSNPGLTDGLGNVVAFAPAGTYWCQYYGPNISTQVQPCIFPGTVGSWASPGPIGSLNPNTGTFTTLTAGTFGGNPLFSGNPVFGGNTTLTQLNTMTYFPSQATGADASCKIQAVINSLPANGFGVLNAIDLTDSGGTGACNIDPGTKTVWIYLGATAYHVTQVTIRTNLHILGMGSGQGLSSTKNPTTIQAMGNNATAPFVLSQTATEGQEGIVLRGFRLTGAAGNTSQNGIFISTPATGGLWYSEFDDLFISGFAGIGLDLEAPNGGGINQFSTFKRVVVFRTNGGSYALQIKGFNNSLKFENCQFDGGAVSPGGDGLTNINIDDFNGGTFPPYNIKFDLLTSQWAGIAMNIDAGDAISVDQGHFEGDFNAITTGPGDSFGPLGITVHDSWFGNGTGIHAGAGSIINNVASSGNASIQFINSHIYAAPDVVFKGSNLASIYQCGISVGPEGSYNYLPCSNRSTGVIALDAATPINAHTCHSAQTVAISGVATTSALSWSFTSTPVGVTGYGDNTTPFLVVTVFPTANTANAVVCNTSAGNITPGAISIRIAAQNTAP